MKVGSYYRSVQSKSTLYQVTEVSDSAIMLKRRCGGTHADPQLVEVTKARFNKAFVANM